MSYQTCTIWTRPGLGVTRPWGPVYGEFPAIRQVVECEDCGQLWLYDLLEDEDLDSPGEGRVIYAPIPHAIREVQVGEIDADVADQLVPRLVLPGHDPDRAERVT